MIYLLSGENSFEISRQVDELAGKFEGEVTRVDGGELSPEDLPNLLAGVSLFSSQRLMIIKDASINKAVWNSLGDWLERGVDNDLILVEKNPDKRTKTYKWIDKNGRARVVAELKPFEAERWVAQQATEQKIKLGREEAAFLVDFVGVDQWLLQSALTKLSLSGQSPTKDLIRQLIEPTLQATSFELLDAAFAGNQKLLQDRLAIVSRGEDPYMFFGLMASQIYALTLMHYAAGRQPDSVAKEASVHPFVLTKVSGLARKISRQELDDMVQRLATLDDNLKSRPVDPWVQISSFMLSLN